MFGKLLSLLGCKFAVFFRLEVVVKFLKGSFPEKIKKACFQEEKEDKKQIDDKSK